MVRFAFILAGCLNHCNKSATVDFNGGSEWIIILREIIIPVHTSM
jgi:hypothetical protein